MFCVNSMSQHLQETGTQVKERNTAYTTGRKDVQNRHQNIFQKLQS